MRRTVAGLCFAVLAILLISTACGSSPAKSFATSIKPPPPPPPPPSPTPSRTPVVGDGPLGTLRNTGTDAVALTFDDGPDPVNTPRILDLLKQYHVHATFCLVGFRVRDHPEIVKRIADEGHTLCNHTWQHLLDFSKRDDGYVQWDFRSTNEAIERAAPGVKVQYFRAPGGNFNPRILKFSNALGMTPLYWAIDDESWKNADFGTGANMNGHISWEVKAHVKPGSIILSHDMGRPWTYNAYQSLLPWLQQNFKLEPMPVT
jgi:peptidoglycan/xylan/chitin deacetylase (PgdA/CDA1 family)